MSTDHIDGEVRAVAAALIAAFSDHDPERYFSFFIPEATFLFHSSATYFDSRAAYERAWREWERDGFRVLECHTVHAEVHRLTDDTALFIHELETTLQQGEGARTFSERESILFVLRNGRWLGAHEHASPLLA